MSSPLLARRASANAFSSRGSSSPRLARSRAVAPVGARQPLRVAAMLREPKPSSDAPSTSVLASAKASCDRFFQRYDVLSTGMGALAVTSYCVLRGQDAGTALSITFGSTVLALVVNELMSDSV